MMIELYIIAIPLLAISADLALRFSGKKIKAILSAALYMVSFILSLVLLLGGTDQHTIFNTTGAFALSFAGNKIAYGLLSFIAFVQFCLSLREASTYSSNEKYSTSLNHLSVFSLFALILSANLLTVFISSLFSSLTCLLIVFYGKKSFSASKLALYLGVSEMMLFFGVMLLYFACGSFDFSIIRAVQPENSAIKVIIIAGTILLALAPAAKALLFPMHFWSTGIVNKLDSKSMKFLLALMIPSGIVLYIKIVPVLSVSAQVLLVVISLLSILYSVLQSITARDKEEFIKCSVMADSGLVVLSAAFGNYSLAVFLLVVFTLGRLLLTRTSFDNKLTNPALHYWFSLGALMFYAGVPLTAKYAGYSFLIGSAGVFNSVFPGAGIIFPVAAYAVCFASSFVLIKFFFGQSAEDTSFGRSTVLQELVSNADIILFAAASLFVWYLPNPFNPTGIWFINLASSANGMLIQQDNQDGMIYVYSLIALSSAGLGAFFGFLRAGKDYAVTRSFVFAVVENWAENRIDRIIHPRVKVTKKTESVKWFGAGEISFSFSVLFILIVLFYFIFRSM